MVARKVIKSNILTRTRFTHKEITETLLNIYVNRQKRRIQRFLYLFVLCLFVCLYFQLGGRLNWWMNERTNDWFLVIHLTRTATSNEHSYEHLFPPILTGAVFWRQSQVWFVSISSPSEVGRGSHFRRNGDWRFGDAGLHGRATGTLSERKDSGVGGDGKGSTDN